MTVPIVETARLVLRGHRLDDFADSAAMWADPSVTRHIGGKPSTREEAWTRFLRYLGHWAAMGFGYWVVSERGSGRFVGEVGFADYKREIEPSLEGAMEIGWVLSPSAHGKGFATEAANAALAWGTGHFASTRIVCLIDPENEPSIRVAEKCGFKEIGRTTYKGDPTIVFERERASIVSAMGGSSPA
jgi:RimJ/RimL family protein N-acetyltransferase